MAQYDPKEFYQIFTQSIRAGKVVPFDCYLLLEQNNNIICIVKKDQIFEQEKIGKLFSYDFSKLYVKNEDKEIYFKYLNEFFGTEEGRTVYNQIKDSEQAVVGLPEEEVFIINSLKELEETYGKVIGKFADEEPTHVKGKIDSFSQILDLFHNEISHLSENKPSEKKLPDEEQLRLNNFFKTLNSDLFFYSWFSEIV